MKKNQTKEKSVPKKEYDLLARDHLLMSSESDAKQQVSSNEGLPTPAEKTNKLTTPDCHFNLNTEGLFNGMKKFRVKSAEIITYYSYKNLNDLEQTFYQCTKAVFNVCLSEECKISNANCGNGIDIKFIELIKKTTSHQEHSTGNSKNATGDRSTEDLKNTNTVHNTNISQYVNIGSGNQNAGGGNIHDFSMLRGIKNYFIKLIKYFKK